MFSMRDYIYPMKLRLKEVRTERGLTIDELSAKSGTSKGFLSDVERNKKSPSAAKLELIAKCLDCSLIDLIDVPELPPELRRLLSVVRELPDDLQQEVLSYAEFRAHSEKPHTE